MTPLRRRAKRPIALPHTMTDDWLREHDACFEDRLIFRTEWPEGVAASREALVRASQLGLNLDWLADLVLPRAAAKTLRAKIVLVCAAYAEQCAWRHKSFMLEINVLKTAVQGADFALAYYQVHAGYAEKYELLDHDEQNQRYPLLIDALWLQYERKGEAL